jgi:tRNA-Thr(GGU) m(6)t(6)A37 methyltransferase TsaA
VPARIEVYDAFVPALLHMEKHSHVWVLAWLAGAERDVLQVIPRGIADRSPENLHGVFAVRAPVRPNPIGLTAARITRLEPAAIEVDRLDFLDGTPVLDLKPYFWTRDMIFSAANLQLGKPAGREALRDSLRMQAVNFHGEFCPELALGVRMVEHLRAEILEMKDPGEISVTAPLGRPCLIDALIGTTRATPGRRTLRFHSAESVRFEHGGAVYEYHLVEGWHGHAAEVLESDDGLLFRYPALS